MVRKITRLSVYLLVSLMLTIHVSYAQEEDTAKAEESKLTVEEQRIAAEKELEELFSEVTQRPDDLDLNFKYAQLATKLGKYDEAIAAYERMLIVNPSLNRVKLDMALVYMKSGSYAQAKKLFEDVMAQNPPQTVQDNINRLMAVVRQAEKKHHLSGSITIGFNSDSNASASPATGAVDLFGVSVPLDGSSQAASDDHRFASVTATHTYILPSKNRHTWSTSGTVYKTHQSSIGTLDLTVYSVKTGPTFNIPKLKTKIGMDVGYNDTHLARRTYLQSLNESIKIDHFITPKVAVNLSWQHEKRRFKNTESATTYTLRNGHANEQKLGITVTPTKNDVLTAGVTWRQEMTKTKYNDNRQKSLNVSYTHLFPEDYFLNTSATLKNSQYKGIDTLVNPTTVRDDFERNFSLTFGKKLFDDYTITTSYQWRNIDSNIQNYAYKNERVGVALSYAF